MTKNVSSRVWRECFLSRPIPPCCPLPPPRRPGFDIHIDVFSNAISENITLFCYHQSPSFTPLLIPNSVWRSLFIIFTTLALKELGFTIYRPPGNSLKLTMDASFTFPRPQAPVPRPAPASKASGGPRLTRESNALRASVLNAALELGLASNPLVADWMFDNSLPEEDEEEVSFLFESIFSLDITSNDLSPFNIFQDILIPTPFTAD